MPGKQGQKPWTTLDEETFLQDRLPAYIESQAWRAYNDFWAETYHRFFKHSPEQARLCDVPQGGELTDLQRDQLAQKILKLKKVELCNYIMIDILFNTLFKSIKSWYRWWTNVVCLACSSGSKSVLKLKTTLVGGDELRGTRTPQEVEMYSQMYYEDCIKVNADAAIAAKC